MITPPVGPKHDLLNIISLLGNNLLGSVHNNSWWVIVNCFSNLLSGGFSEFRLDTVELTGDFWPAAARWRSGFCCFPCSSSLTWACFPITVAPWLYNVFNSRQAGCELSAGDKNWQWEDKTDKRGKREERGREERQGWKCWMGFPGFPLPRIPSQSSGPCQPKGLPRHIPEHWLHLSPCPHSTSLSAQTMNKRACLLAAESEQRRAEGRHFLEIVANNSRELCPEAGREAGNMARLSLRTGNGRADRRSSQRQLLFRIHYWITARIIETPSQHHIWVWLDSINKPGPLVQNTNMIKFSAVTMATWLMKAPRKTSVFTR